MFNEFLKKHNIDRIDTYFMPIIDAKTNKLASIEALARFFDPNNNILNPFDIISNAEETSVINNIFYKIFEDSCKFAKEVKYPVAINLSPKQINDNKFLYNEIIEIIEDCFTPKNLIELEITENIKLKDYQSCNDFIYKLKNKGIKFSLDDFGTGYSNQETLEHLLVDKLKIDMSLIQDLSENKLKQKIVQNIIDLAHGKNITTVAEGVDNKEQLTLLKKFKCDYIQGYLFSPALEKKEFIKKFIK